MGLWLETISLGVVLPSSMCGRYITPDEAAIERHWGLMRPQNFFQSYNVDRNLLLELPRFLSVRMSAFGRKQPLVNR